MFVKLLYTFPIFVVIPLICAQYSRPKNFPRCNINDVNLNQCMLQATEDIRPQLIKGVPELNMIPITAYPIPKVEFEQGTQAMNYKATLTDITMRGLETYKFSKLDFVNNQLILKYKFPHLNSDCKYEIKGKILLVPVEGRGNLKLNITEMDLDLTMILQEATRNNKKYLDPVETKSKITLKDVDVEFDGLFGGNPILEEAALKTLYENKAALIQEFTPALEEATEKIVEEYVYNHILKIPYDELFITK